MTDRSIRISDDMEKIGKAWGVHYFLLFIVNLCFVLKMLKVQTQVVSKAPKSPPS